MSDTRYRRGPAYAAEMARYARMLSDDGESQSSRLKRNLVRCLREDLTPKQQRALILYYSEGLTMREIGERLGVNRSTVSRTIKRGEARLQRCLRYGAEAYLRSMGP